MPDALHCAKLAPMLLGLLTTIAIVLYLAAALLLVAPVTGCPRTPRRLGLGAAWLATACHAGTLLSAHGGRLDLHFFAALSLVACVVAVLTLLVNLTRPVAGLGIVVFPVAALLLGLDVFLASPTTPVSMAWPIKLHVAVALLAYSVLSIAAALAVLLAIQERALRTHKPGRMVRALPPLTQTEDLLFRLIAAGFTLLTLTLLSGALFVRNIRDQHLAHIISLSILAWLIFGALLWGRRRYGWRGSRAVNLTLIGMAVLALGFFGSKFVLELVLSRA